MKNKSNRSVLVRSLLSVLVLGIFMLLATGSLEILEFWGIDVIRTDLGGGVYREVEYHHSITQKISTEGPQDPQGRWNGWITTNYSKTGSSALYEEHVYMLHGKRQGLCTRTYPDGHTEEENYLNGWKIQFKKSVESGLAEGSAFNLLQERYPWFLFMMEAFTFDNQYVENYLDTLEAMLAANTFDPSEFDDYFDQVRGNLDGTPYDSIILSTDGLIASIGFRYMKNDELRLAVLERQRTGGNSTYDMLESDYPNYIDDMNGQGVSTEDLMAFCSDLDDSLSMFQAPDPEDSFFVDSVDTHFFIALTSVYGGTKKNAWTLKTGGYPASLHQRKAATPVSENTNLTPSEVAEVALGNIVAKTGEADFIRVCVHDAYFTGKGLAFLPVAATEFERSNSATSVTLNGYVLDDGGAMVTSRGIAWAMHNNPVGSGTSQSAGSGTGSFQVTLEGLTEGETYYARSYAINSEGVAYGNQISFVAESSVGTGKERQTEDGLKLYPNPASTSVTISFTARTDGEFEAILLDLSGRILQRESFEGTKGAQREITFNVSAEPAGLYRCEMLENGIPVAGRELVISR